MNFDFNSAVPIYLQVAEQLEAGILQRIFPEGSQVPSTTEISKTFKINPTTVLKGVNLLVEEGILEKRRGVGMFVCQNAFQHVLQKGKKQFFTEQVGSLVTEAKKLGIGKEELVAVIKENYEG
ncbi:MAG: GntR family transcriptional regulator [Turicibacter sp.]|nr:GntR family transcriptional regulator [Turicibacter sp.]